MNGRSLFPPFGGKHPPRLFWFAFAKTGIFGGIYERALTNWYMCTKRWYTVFLDHFAKFWISVPIRERSLTYWCNCTKRWCTTILVCFCKNQNLCTNLWTGVNILAQMCQTLAHALFGSALPKSESLCQFVNVGLLLGYRNLSYNCYKINPRNHGLTPRSFFGAAAPKSGARPIWKLLAKIRICVPICERNVTWFYPSHSSSPKKVW